MEILICYKHRTLAKFSLLSTKFTKNFTSTKHRMRAKFTQYHFHANLNLLREVFLSQYQLADEFDKRIWKKRLGWPMNPTHKFICRVCMPDDSKDWFGKKN